MFFKKAKRIKKLEEQNQELKKELEIQAELALENHMELKYKEWQEERRDAQ
ncbi:MULTISPECIES: hypothetical protein [Niallia]|uniref:hypothetical protein n=1 Tax=Niallia TaxID=2837506 RepID=UPI00203FCEE7|nr:MULTISPECIES: hypothetical protein [Niallia]MCM3032879.1 hypothetical protein [Niallia sp. MER 6]MDK8643848.1 hypothetical protein [Niallia taxi]